MFCDEQLELLEGIISQMLENINEDIDDAAVQELVLIYKKIVSAKYFRENGCQIIDGKKYKNVMTFDCKCDPNKETDMIIKLVANVINGMPEKIRKIDKFELIYHAAS